MLASFSYILLLGRIFSYYPNRPTKQEDRKQISASLLEIDTLNDAYVLYLSTLWQVPKKW